MTTRRGRIRTLTIAFISLLAIFSLLISGMPSLAAVPLSVLVAAAAWHRWYHSPMHFIKLERHAPPSLDGTRGDLSGEAVTSLFVALKLIAPEGAVRRVFLFRDELEPDDFRALLVYLRHG